MPCAKPETNEKSIGDDSAMEIDGRISHDDF